jgi:hypothetical protein
MKYLVKREQFLIKSKYNDLSNYDNTPYSGEKFKLYESSSYATNQGAGPFHNDIGWNDSLVGRFINHLIRKAKIIVGSLQMKGLIRRLNSQFELINDESIILRADSETKSTIYKIALYSFFYELIKAIEEGAKVSILLELTNSSLEKLNTLDEFEEKESLKKELESFIKFLEQFKDEDGEEDGEEDDEEDELGQDKDTENDEVKTSTTDVNYYKYMIQNLKSISTIILKVSTMKIGSEVAKKDIKKHKTTSGDTVNKIAQANNISTDVIWSKNANTKIDNKGTTLTQWITKAQNNPANKSKKIVNGKETFINRDKNDITLPKDVLLLLEKDQFGVNRQVKDPKQLQQQQKVKNATKTGVIAGGETAKEIGFEVL